MTKKILCIVLAVTMLMGSFAVIGSAIYRASEAVSFDDYDLTKYYNYDPDSDYHVIIDNVLLAGYSTDGTRNEADIVENLKYWDDSIIDQYNENVKNNITNEQWYDFYCLMMTPLDEEPSPDFALPEELVGIYFKYRREDKAEMDFRFETDTTTAKPGDTITLKVYLKSNFWAMQIQAGIRYDKNLVTPVDAKGFIDGWNINNNYNWFNKSLEYSWPDSMQNDYAYQNYAIMEIGAMPDTYNTPEGTPEKFEEEILYQEVKIKIKDDATIGSTATFTMHDDFEADIIKDEITGRFDGLNRPTIILRSYSPTVIDAPDFTALLGHTITYNSVSVQIVSEDSQPANYGDFNKAIEKYNELLANKDIYTTETWDKYEEAFNAADAVDRNLTIDEQTTVDNATKALTDEYDKLQKKPANYDDFNNAIEKYNELLANKDIYTTETWDKYEEAFNAADAVDRNLKIDEQTTVNNATKTLTDAQKALEKIAGPVDPNEKGIISADVKGDPIVGAENKIEVTVKGSPDSIRLSNDDETLTFSRDDAIVTKDSDGNEVWTIKALATKDSTTYTAYVKYENEDYLDDGYEFTVKARSLDLKIHSLLISDMEGNCLERGRHEVIARTSTDVLKLQFVYPDGTTCTFINGQTGYTDATVTTDEATGELVWTFSFNFVNLGDVTYNFRTRASVTSFAGGVHDPLNVTVLY